MPPRAARKTGIKTASSPKGGARLPLGAHPGNTGGKPGRSGRKPKAWTDFCSATVTDPEFQQAIKDAALAGDMTAAKMLTEYAVGKPPQPITGEGGKGPVAHCVTVHFVAPGAK